MHPTILERFKNDFKLNENDLFIIQYIIEHSEEITSYSSHQLAKETYSSPTAIIRLVKKIGFKNYNDFKKNLSNIPIVERIAMTTTNVLKIRCSCFNSHIKYNAGIRMNMIYNAMFRILTIMKNLLHILYIFF